MYRYFNSLEGMAGLALLSQVYDGTLRRRAGTAFLGCLLQAGTELVLVRNLGNSYGNPMGTCLLNQGLFLAILLLEGFLAGREEGVLPILHSLLVGLVPAGCVFVLHLLVRADVDAFERGSGKAIAVYLLILAADIFFAMLYRILRIYYKNFGQKREREQILYAQTNQLQVVDDSREQAAALRHDLKHHLRELRLLTEAGQKQRLLAYLDEMESFLDNSAAHAATGNRNVDSTLNYLLEKADKVLKQVEVKVSIPAEKYAGDFRLCVILGNLLDNAIREAEKTEEQFLSVVMRENRGLLLIWIRNSYLETEKPAEARGGQGLGLKNVKKIVDSLEGEFQLTYAGGYCQAEVLLYARTLEES